MRRHGGVPVMSKPPDPSLENDALLRDWKKKQMKDASKKKRNCRLGEREKSYTVRVGDGVNTRIPHYESEKDKYCPLARARVFNRYQEQRARTAPSGGAPLKDKRMLADTNDDLVIPFKGRKGLPSQVYQGEKRFALKASAAASADASTASSSTKKDDISLPSGARPDPELEVVKKVIIRDALVQELRMLLNDTGDKSVVSGVASQARAVECCRLLLKIRSQTIEIVEGIKEWRRSKFNMSMPFKFQGKNFLLRIINDLDFVDGHEKVLDVLGFRMRSNPFVLADNDLAPNPFLDKAVLKGAAGGPINMLPSDLEHSRIRECERAIVEEAKRYRYTIRPPSAKALVAWALDKNSALPETTEFKMRIKEIEVLEKRIKILQDSIEADDMELLQLERLVRPMTRELVPLREKVAHFEEKVKQAQLSHAEVRLAKARTELDYWAGEHDNLEIQIKAKKSTIFLKRMEISRQRMQVGKWMLDVNARRKQLKERIKLRAVFEEQNRIRAATIIQCLVRKFVAYHKRRRLQAQRDEAYKQLKEDKAAGHIQRALKRAMVKKKKRRCVEGEDEAKKAAERPTTPPPIKTFRDSSCQTEPVIIVPYVARGSSSVAVAGPTDAQHDHPQQQPSSRSRQHSSASSPPHHATQNTLELSGTRRRSSSRHSHGADTPTSPAHHHSSHHAGAATSPSGPRRSHGHVRSPSISTRPSRSNSSASLSPSGHRSGSKQQEERRESRAMSVTELLITSVQVPAEIEAALQRSGHTEGTDDEPPLLQADGTSSSPGALEGDGKDTGV